MDGYPKQGLKSTCRSNPFGYILKEHRRVSILKGKYQCLETWIDPTELMVNIYQLKNNQVGLK